MTESMISVGGGNVWADDSGGDLPPLVLLHPGIGDSRIWDPILPALRSTHRVIRYDARGYGHSPASTTEFTLLDDLVTVLEHYGIERTAIVGCSQGGGTALALAVTKPERVSAIVLLCPGIPGFEMNDAEMQAIWEKAEADGVESVEDVAEIGMRLWGAAGVTPEVREQFLSSARAWINGGDFDQPDPPVYDRLGEIGVPTSLLIGDLDRPALIESNLRAAERIPGCRLVEVSGVDHLPPLRIPDQVLQLIIETLAR